MTQADIMIFLDKHKGRYFSAKDIRKEMNTNIVSTYHALSKIVRREEYSMKIVPNNKSGFGSNFITLYSSIGGKKNE